MQGCIQSLIDYGFYQYKDTYLHKERLSPYTVRYPIPTPMELIENISKAAFAQDIFSTHRPIHCIGIANSGVSLAKALVNQGKKMDRDMYITIVSKENPKILLQRRSDNDLNILVDNAVTTGNTMCIINQMLIESGIRISIALRIFNREEIDIDGMTAESRLKILTGIELHSIFSIRDLLPLLPDEQRKNLENYLKKYGTQSIKQFL